MPEEYTSDLWRPWRVGGAPIIKSGIGCSGPSLETGAAFPRLEALMAFTGRVPMPEMFCIPGFMIPLGLPVVAPFA